MGYIELIEGVFTNLDLSDFGVPEDAEIWDLSLTAIFETESQGLTPAVHLNRYQDFFRLRKFLVTGVAWHGMKGPGTASVHCRWFVPGAGSDAETILASVRALGGGRLLEAVITGSAAVEDEVRSVLLDYYTAASSKEKAKRLIKETDFDSQLSVLLPATIQSEGLPRWSSQLQLLVADMRVLRNGVAHTKNPPSNAQAGRAVAAAVFGWCYLKYYGPALRRGPGALRFT